MHKGAGRGRLRASDASLVVVQLGIKLAVMVGRDGRAIRESLGEQRVVVHDIISGLPDRVVAQIRMGTVGRMSQRLIGLTGPAGLGIQHGLGIEARRDRGVVVAVQRSEVRRLAAGRFGEQLIDPNGQILAGSGEQRQSLAVRRGLRQLEILAAALCHGLTKFCVVGHGIGDGTMDRQYRHQPDQEKADCPDNW